MPVLQGVLNWMGGSMFTDANNTWATDQAYIDGMASDQVLMAALSPVFYTRASPLPLPS